MARTAVCPWWAGYSLNWSVRKLVHPPEKLLGPYLESGMAAMDIGCGMGYFTIPMAQLVGETGKVLAVDLQQEMLDGMAKNAEKAGVHKGIIPLKCESDTLGLEAFQGTVDFALAFMMVHEVTHPERLMREIHSTLCPGGVLLFAEPVVHVGKPAYRRSLEMLEQCGFKQKEMPRIAICRAALLEKTGSR